MIGVLVESTNGSVEAQEDTSFSRRRRRSSGQPRGAGSSGESISTTAPVIDCRPFSS